MQNILLVDDHPLTLSAYENLLKKSDIFKIKSIFKAVNVEEAVSIINEKQQIDIAFLDISMPKNNLEDIDDGIDLAMNLKLKHPNAKSEFYILLKAIHLVKPEIFFSKNEIDNFSFSSILEALKKEEQFYSQEMLQVYKWTKNNKVKLDNYDFQILSLTNKGVKTKELIHHLPLSLSAIEKRKSYHKLIFTDFK